MQVIPVEGGTIVRYSTPEGQPLGSLDDGGLVELSEVKGLCADSLKSATNPTGSVNGLTLRMSTEKGDPKFTFRISTETTGADGKAVATPLAGLSAWEGGGLITEKKEPRVVPFKSLEECSLAPGGLGDGLVMTDVSFSMRELQLHVAFQAIFAFASAENRLPGVNNVEDAAKVVRQAPFFGHPFLPPSSAVVTALAPPLCLRTFCPSCTRLVKCSSASSFPALTSTNAGCAGQGV